MNPIFDRHFAQLQGLEPQATMQAGRPDGAILVSVPGVPLPPHKWTKDKTTIEFLAPLGYPQARPDCFYADMDLRLLGGGMPVNANIQAIPGGPERLWFSWHLSNWNPNNDTLITFYNVIKQRLRDAR
jgi:hypothetical protein